MTRPSVDFKRLKEITFEQTISFLTELQLYKREGQQLRFLCPACGGDNKRALSINLDAGFQCFAGNKKGNDAVALVAHVRRISQYDAGKLLQDFFFTDSAPAQRAPSAAKAELDGGTDLAEMLGISPATLSALGWTLAGDRVVVPLRDAKGEQVGTLALATIAEQDPAFLVQLVKHEEKPAPEQRRRLFRVVG